MHDENRGTGGSGSRINISSEATPHPISYSPAATIAGAYPHGFDYNSHDGGFESSPATSSGHAQWTPQSFYSDPTPQPPSYTPGPYSHPTGGGSSSSTTSTINLGSLPSDPGPSTHLYARPSAASAVLRGVKDAGLGFGAASRPDIEAGEEDEAEVELTLEAGPSRVRSNSAGRSARNDKRISAACEPCRRRKRRCDGVKPVCSTCQRSSSRQCVWDTSGDRRKPVNKSMQIALQTRIEALEAQVDNYRQQERPDDSDRDGGKGELRAIVTDEPVPRHASALPPASMMSEPSIAATDPRRNARHLAISAQRKLRSLRQTDRNAPPAKSNESARDDMQGVFASANEMLFNVTPKSLLEHCLYQTFDYGIAPGRLVPRPVFFKAFVQYPESRTDAYSTFLLGSMLCLGAAYQITPFPDALFENSPTHSDREMSVSDTDLGDPSENLANSTHSELDRSPTAIANRFWTLTNYLIPAELSDPLLSTVCGLVGLVKTCFGQGRESLGAMYLDIAVDLCNSLDLNQNHAHRATEADRLHTLTFWSCFWVETILAMRQNRTSRFSTADLRCGLPPVQPELDAAFPHFISEGYKYQIQLFCIASDIVEALHDISGCVTGRNGAVGAQTSSSRTFERITSFDLRLERWYNELPSGLRTSSNSTTMPDPHILCISTFYYLVSLTLHRPFFANSGGERSDGEEGERMELARFSRLKAIRSVREVVRLVKCLERDGGLRRCNPFLYMPVTKAAECLIALGSVKPRDGDPEAGGGTAQAERDLDILLRALRQIGAVWEAAKRDEEVLALARRLVVPPASH